MIDDEEMAALVDEVADAEVPIVIWVGPSGARAYEGSGQLVLVADVSGMSPGSRDRQLRRPARRAPRSRGR